MDQEVLSLTKSLVAIPSTADNNAALKEVLDVALKPLQEFTIEKFSKMDCPSALIHNQKPGTKHFRVILNAHLDVVPGKKEQYTLQQDGDKLLGRGADDMKASAAVLVYLFKEIAAKVSYPLALQLVTDEEVGGFYGARYQAEEGITTDFYLTGETTELNIKNEAKGVLWLKATALGKTAHGAYPQNGDNALWKLKKYLDKLESAFPVPTELSWKTTLNLSAVSTTNGAYNKVPDYAEAKLDVRYIPSEAKTILPKLKSLLTPGVELEVVEADPFHYTDPNNKDIQALLKIAREFSDGKKSELMQGQGASDARHYSAVGVPAIEFGPIGGGLHSDEEWVSIKGLETYSKILKEFLLRAT